MPWKPIKTAPRDGTPILLSGRVLPENKKISVLGLYIEDNHCKWTFYDHEQDGWDSFMNERPPTHWQPLPRPAR